MRFMILTFVVIVFIMSYVSFGGIIVDCFTLAKAKKYVKLRGNYSFKNVKQFFIFSMVIFGISWFCIGIYLFSGIYSIFNSQPFAETLTELEVNAGGHTRELIKAAFCHLMCIVGGFITINGYKTAKKSRSEFELPESDAAKAVVCGSCGKINKSENKFCVCCGKDLTEEKSS
ncbi:MAG: hypothetical protein NC203_04960 [Firmicutes bacterium]|nr:hypothetical protein [[Eubacterium] siraeum]MCM1487700.1 hypothetical protein [Bacillota bacterium]